MNLIPMDYSGTKQVGHIWGNLMAQIPKTLMENKKFQVEMDKLGDVDTQNDTVYSPVSYTHLTLPTKA